MTLQDFKDQVATGNGFKNWEELKDYCYELTGCGQLMNYIEEAAELHAKAREKEAQGAKFRLEWFENGYVAAGGRPGDKCEEAYLKSLNSYK